MKYKSLLATLVAVGTLQAHASSVADGNLAYQDSKVRITLISPGAVRLEYQPDGRFIDNPSFIAVSRDYPNAATNFTLNATNFTKNAPNFTPNATVNPKCNYVNNCLSVACIANCIIALSCYMIIHE